MDDERLTDLTVFVVERFLPGLTTEGVHAQARRESDIANAMTDGHHLRTTYLCADELCFSVFTATSIDDLRAANDRLAMDYERITEAVDVTAAAVRDD